MRIPAIAVPTPGFFDVTDYGAKGDGTTDDGPAFQAAFNALLAAGGGIIILPACASKYRIATGVVASASNGQVCRVIGPGPLYGDTGGVSYMFNLTAFSSFIWDQTVFLGSTGNTTKIDCQGIVETTGMFELIFRGCLVAGFYAANASNVGTDLVSLGGNTRFEGCIFGGNSSTQNIHVVTLGNFECDDVRFQDYWNFGGEFYSKTPYGNGNWIKIETGVNGQPITGSTSQGTVQMKNMFFDEGAQRCVMIANTSNPSLYVDRVHIDGVTALQADISGANIIYVYGANHVIIENLAVDIQSTATNARSWLYAGNIQRSLYVRNTTTNPDNPSTVDLDIDIAVAVLENCDYSAGITTTGLAAGSTIAYDIIDGVRSRWRLSQNALDANTIGKPGATAGYVDQLGTGDNGRLALGVILDSVGAGAPTRVVEENGQQVEMLSDGAGVLAPAETLAPSTLNAGRVAKTISSGAQSVGLTMGSAVATANTPVQAIWQRGTY